MIPHPKKYYLTVMMHPGRAAWTSQGISYFCWRAFSCTDITLMSHERQGESCTNHQQRRHRNCALLRGKCIPQKGPVMRKAYRCHAAIPRNSWWVSHLCWRAFSEINIMTVTQWQGGFHFQAGDVDGRSKGKLSSQMKDQMNVAFRQFLLKKCHF